jgi:hypothetical protein
VLGKLFQLCKLKNVSAGHHLNTTIQKQIPFKSKDFPLRKIKNSQSIKYQNVNNNHVGKKWSSKAFEHCSEPSSKSSTSWT